jgi:hypothetical protein
MPKAGLLKVVQSEGMLPVSEEGVASGETGALLGLGLASGETGALLGLASGEMGVALGVAEGATGTAVALGVAAGAWEGVLTLGVGLACPRRPQAATSSTTRAHTSQPDCLFMKISWSIRDPKGFGNPLGSTGGGRYKLFDSVGDLQLDRDFQFAG